MSIFNWFKSKPKQEVEIKQTEFVFEVHEAVKIGDLYRYTVTANNKEEAFKKLVQYFFGKNMNQKVKSKHATTSYPNQVTFEYKNMPYWFAKRISGHIKDKGRNYQHELEKYCTKNNIKLKENY
jgi:hypothetical protein